jgi:hypothetical protein
MAGAANVCVGLFRKKAAFVETLNGCCRSTGRRCATRVSKEFGERFAKRSRHDRALG